MLSERRSTEYDCTGDYINTLHGRPPVGLGGHAAVEQKRFNEFLATQHAPVVGRINFAPAAPAKRGGKGGWIAGLVVVGVLALITLASVKTLDAVITLALGIGGLWIVGGIIAFLWRHKGRIAGGLLIAAVIFVWLGMDGKKPAKQPQLAKSSAKVAQPIDPVYAARQAVRAQVAAYK